MALQRSTETVLRRVVEKADKLKRSTFLKEVSTGGWKIDFTRYPPTVVRPHDEALESFVLTLRFFILGNEPTSFGTLAKLADDASLSQNWKDTHALIRRAVNDLLATAYGEYHYDGGVHRFTNREILETFLYGGLVHANSPAAVAQFEDWRRRSGVFALLEMWFVSTLRSLCEAIIILSEAGERELAIGADHSPDQAERSGT